MSTESTKTDDAGSKRSIAVLGTGRMGSALARALLAAGHTVAVWNRSPEKAATLARLGARVASSVVEAVTGADLVIGNVSDYAATDALIGSREAIAALRGTVFVQLASGTPSRARALERWAREHRLDVLEGAIMATPDFIGTPGCTLLYSGPRALFDRAEPALRALGDNTLFVGSAIGHANALDNALLVVLWGTLHGALQGAALAEAEQLPFDLFLGSLSGLWPVVQETIEAGLRRVPERRFEADATSAATVDTCHASVRYLLEMSTEHGIDTGLLRALDHVFTRAGEAGHAQSDVAAVYSVMR